MSADNWRDYDSLRALGRLTGRMRRLEKLVSAMGLGADEKPPRRADATTRLYLEELIAKYRSLPEGFARSKVLQQFMTAHNRYALRTGDPGFLGFVKGVARDGGAMERAVAIGGLSGLSAAPVVDLLIAALGHDDAPARAAAVGALAQVSGGEAARGHRAIVVGIADDAPEVRWTTALQLEFAVRDPGNVEALLQRIPVETHPIADGRARIERSLDGAPAPVRDVGARALARKPEATTFTPPKVPAVGTDAKPRSDDTTRRYLKRLAAEFLAMSTGPDRLEHLKTIARTHGEYLRQTGDTSLLKMLDALVQAASTADERRAVIHSFVAPRKKAVVDQLVAWSADAHADVRAAAASSLSMVRGGEQSRAQNTIVGLLDDKEQSVRQHAAMFLGGFRDASVIPLAKSVDPTSCVSANRSTSESTK